MELSIPEIKFKNELRIDMIYQKKINNSNNLV